MLWGFIDDLCGLEARELKGRERSMALNKHFGGDFEDTVPALDLLPLEEDHVRRVLSPRAMMRQDQKGVL